MGISPEKTQATDDCPTPVNCRWHLPFRY